MLRKIFLVCGILSSLLYAGMDVMGGLQWENYSWFSNEFSRLSAVGAPSRTIHLVLSPIYSMLVIAFGLGVCMSPGRRRVRRFIGGALIVYAIDSLMWPQFFPEDLSMPVSAFTNVMHIILTIVTVLAWMLIFGFAAAGSGKWFRTYSILTLLVVLVCGALAGSQGPALSAGLPTPWLGFTERMNIYSFMLWVIVLAIALFRFPAEQSPVSSGVNGDSL